MNEGKIFMPDPSIIKTYASYIVPLYLTGKIKCDEKLLDEYLEMNKRANRVKSPNVVLDIEIMAVKAVIESPLSQTGYDNLLKEIQNKCPKLEKFLRQYYSNPINFK
jgi:hypothetical protein